MLPSVQTPPRCTRLNEWSIHKAVFLQTVRLSVMTRTMLPGPAISISFSCQLSSTLIACPPPSPVLRDCICEKPVACGVVFRVEDEGAD